MTAPALPTVPTSGPRWVLANVAIVTARNLHRLVRVPTLIAFATIQPVMFVLLFTYAFGGAIHPPGVARYIDYLLPGLVVLAIAFGASQTGVAIADDLATGMIDRFRALPMARSAVLAGRTAADAVRNLFVIALMTGVASAIGFRFHAGAAAAVAALALALAIGVVFSWIDALLGLLVRDAESAGLAGLFAVIPLVFTSSTFVPVATMPGWLQAFAKINPVTVTVDALRALCLGGPTTRPVLHALAWTAGLLAIAVPAPGPRSGRPARGGSRRRHRHTVPAHRSRRHRSGPPGRGAAADVPDAGVNDQDAPAAVTPAPVQRRAVLQRRARLLACSCPRTAPARQRVRRHGRAGGHGRPRCLRRRT